jgi:uncharacterized membrane protein YbhN (UPF0104 family)
MGKISSRRPRHWSWNLRLVGTILSILLLIWLLWRQDWDTILAAIRNLPVWVIVASLSFLLLRHVWNTVRWFILVRAQHIALGFLRALQLVFSGLFISNFLPSMVGGDVVRIGGLVQQAQNRVAAAASVIVDRIIGVLGMLFVLPFGVPLLGTILDFNMMAAGSLASSGVGFGAKFRAALSKLRDALRLWIGQPGWLVLALVSSWIAVLSYLISVLVLARGLGIPVGLADVAGATVLTYFLTLIPLSINGYGIRELAILAFYTRLGGTAEQATALALITRFLFLLVSLPGVLWAGQILKKERIDSGVASEPDQ